MIVTFVRRITAVFAAVALSAAVVAVGSSAHAAGPGTMALSATVSDSYWQITWHWPSAPVVDPPTVVTVSGGSGSYTYAWQRMSGDPTAYATYPTSQSTGFNNYIPVGDWEPRYSTWRCLITDTSTANMVYSPTVTVVIHVYGYRPPGDPPDQLR